MCEWHQRNLMHFPHLFHLFYFHSVRSSSHNWWNHAHTHFDDVAVGFDDNLPTHCSEASHAHYSGCHWNELVVSVSRTRHSMLSIAHCHLIALVVRSLCSHRIHSSSGPEHEYWKYTHTHTSWDIARAHTHRRSATNRVCQSKNHCLSPMKNKFIFRFSCQ